MKSPLPTRAMLIRGDNRRQDYPIGEVLEQHGINMALRVSAEIIII